MNLEIFIPLIVFYLIMLVIGFIHRRSASLSIEEFYLGKRKSNQLVLLISAATSGRSVWLIFAFIPLAYTIGLASLWTVVGFALADFLMFYHFAPKISNFAEKNDCLTIADCYAIYFKDHSKTIRIMVTVILFLFTIPYIATLFAIGGNLFKVFYNLNPVLGYITIGLIVMTYTVLGGFRTTNFANTLQGLFLMVLLIIIPFVGIGNVGSWSVITDELGLLPQLSQKTGAVIASAKMCMFNPFSLSIGSFFSGLGIGLLLPGNPHYITRLMAFKNTQKFKLNVLIITIGNLVIFGFAMIIGLVARAYFNNFDSLPDSNPHNLVYAITKNLLNPVLTGVFLSALVAAIASSVDSQLVLLSSSIIRDLNQKIIRHKEEPKQAAMVLFSRFIIILFVIAFVTLGFWWNNANFTTVLFSWAGLSASIGSTLVLMFFWKNVTKYGIFAGLIIGTISIYIVTLFSSVSASYSLYPAFFITVASIVGISYIERIFFPEHLKKEKEAENKAQQ